MPTQLNSESTDFGVWAPACGNKTSLNWATTSTQKLIVMIIIIVIILSASFRNELCNVGLEALKHAVNGRAVYVTLTVKLAPETRRERDGREWRERKKDSRERGWERERKKERAERERER